MRLVLFESPRARDFHRVLGKDVCYIVAFASSPGRTFSYQISPVGAFSLSILEFKMAIPATLYSPVAEAYLHQYIGDKLVTVSVFFLVVTTICVSLRVVTRRLTNTPLRLDDYLIFASLIFCVGLTIENICRLTFFSRKKSSPFFQFIKPKRIKRDLTCNNLVSVRFGGNGYHVAALLPPNPSAISIWLKYVLVESHLGIMALNLPKLAILCMYIRIFTTKPYRITPYILAGLTIGNMVAGIISASAACRPFAYIWDKTIPGG